MRGLLASGQKNKVIRPHAVPFPFFPVTSEYLRLDVRTSWDHALLLRRPTGASSTTTSRSRPSPNVETWSRAVLASLRALSA